MPAAAPETFDVLGIPVSITSPEAASELIHGWAGDTAGRFVCVRDVPSLVQMHRDPAMRRLHGEASLVTPDGMPLAVLGKLLGHPVRRTAGADLFDIVCRQSAASGLKHYLYGGKPGVAEIVAERMTAKYPGLQIVGWDSPPFRALTAVEDERAIEAMRASGADVVWVGISSPKQDVWMHEHVGRLPQTLIGIGAAFDFHSGAVRRAPRFMQAAGLEWLWRLLSEPRRLWRRYLILAPQFVWLTARQYILPKK